MKARSKFRPAGITGVAILTRAVSAYPAGTIVHYAYLEKYEDSVRICAFRPADSSLYTYLPPAKKAHVFATFGALRECPELPCY